MLKTKEILNIKIDGKPFRCSCSENILDFCKKKEIAIPTLCEHSDFEKSEALCRMCLVKIKKEGDSEYKIVPSCSVDLTDGLQIITEDKELYRIRKTILELLFLEHAGLCPNCYRNLNCELQDLAIRYSIDQFRFVPKAVSTSSEEALERLRDQLERRVIDKKNPSIARDSAKCIECRRCIKACDELQSVKALSTSKRGIKMGVGTENNTPLECTYCGQCTSHCPTGALIEKNNLPELIKILKQKDKILIAQIAPSVRATLGEEFGMLPGSLVTGKMISALRECGFEKVFDVNVGADLTITEEAEELVGRIKNRTPKEPLPLFTSCCPAWVLFVEQHYPELIPNLSTARSPHLMMSSLIRSYYALKNKIDPKKIVLVSVMPCTAKKYEIERPEFSKNGIKEIDFVITTRELAHLIKALKIPFLDLPEGNFDPTFSESSGASYLFGASGGVAEAAARTAHFYLTGKSLPQLEIEEARGLKGIKEIELKIGKINLRIGVIFGLNNARKIAEEVLAGKSRYDFIEVMACPGGCIGGGGQPIPQNNEIRKRRSGALFAFDKKSGLRESHKNPTIKKLYEEFLYEPNSRKARKFLHTCHYPFIFERKKNFKKSPWTS